MSSFEKKKQETEATTSRIDAKTRASILLIVAIAVFLCSVVACFAMIRRSADSNGGAEVEQHVEDIRYVANASTEPGSSGEENQKELKMPVSVNDSSVLNILLIGYDLETEQTDTLMIISIDTEKGTPAMLSIPRDTYIAGNYEIPKINRVFMENGERGIDALCEAVENMIGFRLDKYVLFDEVSLAALLEVTGGIEFNVPEEPAYHFAIPGEQTLSDLDAFGLFRYRDEYTDVETEPYKVQRDFMARILDTLLQDQENAYDNAEVICDNMQTNFVPGELAFLANLMKDTRFIAAFSRALPGGEITVDDEYFYEVNPESACEILNGHFNPLDEELTEYDVHFRQKQGSSGEGELPEWGFNGGGGGTATTEATDAPDELEPNEEPTETETPTEPPAPLEPGGDE